MQWCVQTAELSVLLSALFIMKIIFPHQENDKFDLLYVCVISVQHNSAVQSANLSVLLSALHYEKKMTPPGKL